MTTAPIIDQWSSLDHKPGLMSSAARSSVPGWVGEDDLRRLLAYEVYATYLSNQARIWVLDDQVQDRREMGDAAAIVRELSQGVLGEDPSIDCPDDLADWFTTWATQEQLMVKLTLLVEMALGLGDSVGVLSWDADKLRPRLATIDPGFYFPALDESSDEFPREVVLAWEFDGADGGREVRMKRWLLATRYAEDGQPEQIVYPWGTSSEECLYWSGTARLRDMGSGTGWAAFAGAATWENMIGEDGEVQPVAGISLAVDFLPVVHVPGDLVSEAEHYGRSVLATAVQALDELAATDTDTANAAALTGSPPLGVETGVVSVENGSDGSSVRTYGPGTVFEGPITALDMSSALEGLRDQAEAWRRRAATNAHVGHIAQSFDGSWPSGYALQLSFRPYVGATARLRRAVLPALDLIGKFAVRMAAKGKQVAWPTDGKTPTVVPSGALPVDADSVIDRIVKLWEAKLISREEAVRLIVPVLGLSTEDVPSLAAAAQHEDFDQANRLMDLLNDPELARAEIGRSGSGGQDKFPPIG